MQNRQCGKSPQIQAFWRRAHAPALSAGQMQERDWRGASTHRTEFRVNGSAPNVLWSRPSPEPPNGIGVERRVIAHERNSFHDGLGNQQALKRVAMVERQ